MQGEVKLSRNKLYGVVRSVGSVGVVIHICYEQSICGFSSATGWPSNRHLFAVHRKNEKTLLLRTFSTAKNMPTSPVLDKNPKDRRNTQRLEKVFPSLNHTGDIPHHGIRPNKSCSGTRVSTPSVPGAETSRDSDNDDTPLQPCLSP